MNNLPERYAYAVTQHLPHNQRKEVADELRATIEDMAVDRAKTGAPTAQDYKAVLQELGDPAVLARKYTATKQYLIGPKWYDAYFKLLVTLLAIVPSIVAAVVIVASIIQGTNPIIQSILQGAGSACAAAIQIAFWVTAVFAVLERTTKPEDIADGWSPNDLPAVPKHPERQISAIEAGTAAAFIAIASGWIALHPYIASKDGQSLFNPNLGVEWVVAFFILMALSFLHHLWKLKVGNWTNAITATSVVLAAVSVMYFLVLVSTQQLINPEYFRAWGVTSSAEDLNRIIGWSVGITTAAIVITEITESIQSFILNRRYKKELAN